MVDDRDVVRAQPAREVLRPAVEPCRPRVLDERSQRGHRTVCRNSWPPSIRRTSSCLPSSSSCSICVCVGSPGIFSTRKWRSATARDLRQVRDRDHLRPLREAPQRLARRRAPSRRRCPRRSRRRPSSRRRRRPRSRARSARARRPRPSRRPARTGSPAVGPDQERHLVRRRSRPASRSRELDPELAVAEADAVQLGRDRGPRTRPPRRRAAFASSAASLRRALLGRRERRAGRLRADRRRPPARPARPVLRRRARAAPRRSRSRKRRLASAIRSSSDSTCSSRSGLGVERVEKPPQLARRLAQSELGVAQLIPRRASSSGAIAGDRGERPLRLPPRAQPRPRPPPGRAPPRPRPRRLRELGHVPEPLPLGAQRRPRRPASARRCPRRARAARRAAPPSAAAPLRQLLVPSTRRASSRQASARRSARRSQLLLAGERVEDVELVRRAARAAAARTGRTSRSAARAAAASPPALRSGPTRRRACGRPRRHAPREDEPLLVLRAAARRAPRARPRRAAPPAASSSASTYASSAARPDVAPRRPSRRAGARSPGRGSSCRRRSRR